MPSDVVVPSRRHRTWPWSGPTTTIKDIALLQSDHHRGSRCGRCTTASISGNCNTRQHHLFANGSTRRRQAVQRASRRSPHLSCTPGTRHGIDAAMQPPSCITGYCMAWSCLDHRDQLSHLDGAIFFGYFFRVVAWAAWLTLTISAETDHDRIPCDQ
jgi:hypothetical protein